MKLFGPKDIVVTKAMFDAWPMNMRKEFVLLARERGEGQSLAEIARQTGVSRGLLAQARDCICGYALPQNKGYHVEDGAAIDPHWLPGRRPEAGDA